MVASVVFVVEVLVVELDNRGGGGRDPSAAMSEVHAGTCDEGNDDDGVVRIVCLALLSSVFEGRVVGRGQVPSRERVEPVAGSVEPHVGEEFDEFVLALAAAQRAARLSGSVGVVAVAPGATLSTAARIRY